MAAIHLFVGRVLDTPWNAPLRFAGISAVWVEKFPRVPNFASGYDRQENLRCLIEPGQCVLGAGDKRIVLPIRHWGNLWPDETRCHKAVHKFHREIVATGYLNNFDILASLYSLYLAVVYRVHSSTGNSE